MTTEPEPSSTLNTIFSVVRQGLPSNPLGRNCMKAAMVGKGYFPFAGLA